MTIWPKKNTKEDQSNLPHWAEFEILRFPSPEGWAADKLVLKTLLESAFICSSTARLPKDWKSKWLSPLTYWPQNQYGSSMDRGQPRNQLWCLMLNSFQLIKQRKILCSKSKWSRLPSLSYPKFNTDHLWWMTLHVNNYGGLKVSIIGLYLLRDKE